MTGRKGGSAKLGSQTALVTTGKECSEKVVDTLGMDAGKAR